MEFMGTDPPKSRFWWVKAGSGARVWGLERLAYPKAQKAPNSQKALYGMVFGPKSLKI